MLLFCFSCTSGNAPPAEEKAPPADTAPATEEQTFEGKGVLESIDHDANRVTISHEDIPGFMNATTMDYDVADSSVVEGLEEGTPIDFTVVVRENGSYHISRIQERTQ